MSKVGSRKMSLKPLTKVIITRDARVRMMEHMSNNANVAAVAKAFCVSPDVSETAKDSGLSTSTTHDNIKRLSKEYDIRVFIDSDRREEKWKRSKIGKQR